MFLETIRVGPMGNFCYLIGDEDGGRGVVIDPAFDGGKIMAAVKARRLDLSCIVLTHHHFDHINAAAAVKARTGATVLGHKESERYIHGDIRLDAYAADGASLDWGGRGTVEIIHTPGHAPGGICLIVDGRWLITGDTLFIGNCGRTDLEGGDAQALYGSLARIKRLSDGLIVCPGHDYGPVPSRTLGEEKKLNPALAAASYEEFLAVP
ncbi:MAG: putative polyketide biosynthesis zinc-dependent hydrolase BaeB [bacterium ADurb.Bin374]|nr:MAG: putative polyketide biosynthesis zinc-dependent hydrolase BaeB [bacterium ADurb.Bin374]